MPQDIDSLPKSPSSLSRARSLSVGSLKSNIDHPFACPEKTWTGPSPAMITISNPTRTPSEGKVTQSRSVRRARVEAIRRRRTAQHVSTFLRINIVVTPSRTFPVTVEADRNIDHLARYVEAEYAFRYPRNSKGGEYQPLECGLLYDVGMVPLRYSDRVGDVLNMNDVVNVLNAYEEESPRQETDPNVIYSVDDLSSPMDTEDPHHSDYEHQPLVDKATSDEAQSIKSPLSPDKTADELQRRTPRGKIYKLIANPTSDDRCISILHNKLGLEYFQQFCTRTYSVENLLFWLDTEMFQFAKSSSSALLLQARYIYITYIAVDAPLQVNLTEEIRKDVPWPLPDGWVVDPNMFDEAQEHVFFILRKQVFPMFEESGFYQQYLKIKRNDREKYEAARITGPFTDFFAPNLDVMRSSADLVSSPTPQWESTSPTNLWMKEQLLDRTMNQFFSSHGPVVDYFCDSNRLTTAQKFRKVQKEKKLAKFFGEKPSGDFIARQVHKQPPSPAFPDDRAVQEVASQAGETGSEFYSKKKKVEKLEGFFGDRLGELQLMDQKLMISGDLMLSKSINEFPAFSMILRRSSSSPQLVSDPYPSLVTSNDLSLEERRLLSKRSKKLRGILGEPLNENIVASALTNPTKGTTTELPADPLPNIQISPTDPTEAEGAPKYPTLRRSHSVDSVQTVDTVLLDRNSREYRRKKLEKLNQFLGEKIPSSTLSGQPVDSDNGSTSLEPQTNNVSSKPLSTKEKQANIKRFNKLERLLGEHPPSDLITNIDTVTLQTQSLAKLGKVLTGPDVVLELVDYISDFDQAVTTGTADYVHVQSPLHSPVGSIVSTAESLQSPDSDIVSNAAKLARQRKLTKLKRFFGDQLDPVHLVEQSILDDLEKSIDDEMTSGKDVSQLKRDLSTLREEIRKRSASLQFTESDVVETTKPPALATGSSSIFGALSQVKPLRASVTLGSSLAALSRKPKFSNSRKESPVVGAEPAEERTSSPSLTVSTSANSSPAAPPSPAPNMSRPVN